MTFDGAAPPGKWIKCRYCRRKFRYEHYKKMHEKYCFKKPVARNVSNGRAPPTPLFGVAAIIQAPDLNVIPGVRTPRLEVSPWTSDAIAGTSTAIAAAHAGDLVPIDEVGVAAAAAVDNTPASSDVPPVVVPEAPTNSVDAGEKKV